MEFGGTETQSAMEIDIKAEFEEYYEGVLHRDLNLNRANDWKLDQNTQCRVTVEKLEIWPSWTDFNKDLDESSDNSNHVETSETSIHLKFKLLVQEMCELLSKCEEKCGVCEEYVQKLQEHIIQSHGSHHSHGHGHFLPEFKCDISNNNFSTSFELERHRETHSFGSASTLIKMVDHPTTTIVERTVHTNQVLRPKSFKQINTGETSTMDETNECQKLFEEEGNLLSHSATHDTNRRREHECEHCRKRFTSYNYLARHLRTHTNEKLYRCPICSKQFSQVGTLARHSETHLAEKTHRCPYCVRSFSQRQRLKIHVRTHTGEKPYECQICHTRFAQKGNLTDHSRTHTGEKPYECQVCKKQFAFGPNLKRHSLTHTGEKRFKCSYCEKVFLLKHELSCHEMTHTGERPYQCNFCSKTFIQQGKLDIHIRIHIGERPYKCKNCSKGFTSAWCLKSHMKTHTG